MMIEQKEFVIVSSRKQEAEAAEHKELRRGQGQEEGGGDMFGVSHFIECNGQYFDLDCSVFY